VLPQEIEFQAEELIQRSLAECLKKDRVKGQHNRLSNILLAMPRDMSTVDVGSSDQYHIGPR
jgi:hypothetical protein